jgi:hypothetical protein
MVMVRGMKGNYENTHHKMAGFGQIASMISRILEFQNSGGCFFRCLKWIYTVAVIYFFHDDGREKRLLMKVFCQKEFVQELFDDEEEDFDDAGDVPGRRGHGGIHH